MTSIQLDRLWLNRLDTGEAIAAMTEEGSRSQKWSQPVEVRTYAGGRQRAISTVGERGELTFKLVLLSLTTVAKLRAWKGVAVQARDHRGQKVFGVFADLDVSEYKDPGLYAATLTLVTVTVTEGV